MAWCKVMIGTLCSKLKYDKRRILLTRLAPTFQSRLSRVVTQCQNIRQVAEAVGFEPTVEFPLR